MIRSTILARMGLRALTKHGTRSILTMLGIMIGIAAIVVTFSIGRGAEIKVKNQILAIGERAIYILPGNVIETGTIRSNSANAHKLKEKDLFAIKQQCNEVEEISRGHDSIQRVDYGIHALTEHIYGNDANMLDINQNKIKIGSFYSENDVIRRHNVVVLGLEISKKLFKNEYPIGKTIRINKIPFTVIGIVDHVDFFWGTQDPNNRIYIPFTVAKKYFQQDDEAVDDLNAIAIKLKDGPPGVALRKIKRILQFMHEIGHGQQDDFTIFDQQSIAESAATASNIIKMFGLIAASISLIVGGIGVMSIMMVAVSERTREIGIRLAIGATRQDIQFQFLFESIVLSCAGGIFGIVIGIISILILNSITQLPGTIELLPLMLAFCATILIGIFFGYYPAVKASLLNPVDALRE